jgi:two-component system chemotaxis sensor kinase CheA
VPLSALDRRLLEAEELLSAKLFTSQRAAELGMLAARFEPWHKECVKAQTSARALRARSSRRTDRDVATREVDDLVEFFEWNQDYVRALESRVVALRRAADQDQLALSRLVDDLLDNSKKLVMLPLATLGSLLPKVVRDLSRDQGKDVELILQGEDVRIDKRILEEMKDPLIHLLRNCVDHGIESPEDRRRAGKPERAHISLAVSSVDGNQIEMRVTDDGRGIDVAQVKAAAIRQGTLAAEDASSLNDAAALALVFEPDLSTSPIITNVSGRGLGLAIVRERAERLGGRVTVESEPGLSTTIRVILPLTLATFRGVLVEAEQRRFVIPTAQVERVTRFRSDEVQTVEGREALTLNGRSVSLVRLADVLKLPLAQRASEPPRSTPLVVLGSGEQRMAFAVNAVVEEREVLLKPLRKPLSRVRNVLGATVLGSGEVAPVLNVSDLLKSGRNAGSPARGTEPPPAVTAQAKHILVAEDSITSRMLLKGILESAGYRVKTVVDGMEAFTALRAERFDALVSDVEMPRLNGFDLTARIRADRALSELPVILVTALGSREHRERGVDVGANAYLVKSDLDQSDLLEALRRLA